MKTTLPFREIFITAVFSCFSVMMAQSQTIYNSNDLRFLNSDLPLQVRVDDLVSRLTIEEKVLQLQHTAPAVERLGIPQYNWWNECLHGVARNGLATVFPQAIGMAATFNPELIQQEADVISTEGRAKYYEAIGKGQHEIDPEQLHEDRSAAEEFDIGGGKCAHRHEAADAAKAGEILVEVDALLKATASGAEAASR